MLSLDSFQLVIDVTCSDSIFTCHCFGTQLRAISFSHSLITVLTVAESHRNDQPSDDCRLRLILVRDIFLLVFVTNLDEFYSNWCLKFS